MGLAFVVAACDATSNLGGNVHDAEASAVDADSEDAAAPLADAASGPNDAGPDGGPPASCAGPEDCSSTGGVCCASLLTGPGTPPACPLASYTTTCAPTCATNVVLTKCEVTTTLRLCHAAADCANEPAGATRCCEYPPAGVSLAFCLTRAIAKGLPCK